MGEDHPTTQRAVEHVADDLSEVFAQGERLRDLVEQKIARFTATREHGLVAWADRLTALKHKLERAMADVDARTDEIAGRFPREPQPRNPDATI
jgi:hypothetical protein